MSASLNSLCNSVMRAVVAAGVVNHSNVDKAIEVMRAEVKAFLFGDEYRGERELVVLNAAHERVAIGIVVASCISKIQGAGR